MPTAQPRLFHILACLVLCMMLVACGAKQTLDSGQDDIDYEALPTLEMDPVVIRVHRGEDGEFRTSSAELRQLFEEATAYFKAGDFPNALRFYQTVLDATDDDIWVKAAMYNSGLSWEGLEAWEEAAQTFDEIIDRFPTSREARDGFFRLAEAMAWLGEFHRVPSLMTQVMQRPDVDIDRRLEALVRAGTAHFELRQFADAERTLGRVLTLDEESRAEDLAAGRSIRRGRTAIEAVAQANYLLGRIYHEIFLEIRMVLPVEQYKKDLADKQRLFEQALEWYTRAVRTGNVFWAPQAGLMMGRLYENYYTDILASEVPAHFTEEQKDIYFNAMREYLAPTLDRAISMYEQALGMAFRMGNRDAAADAILESIDRLKQYRDEQVGWQDEHIQVFEGSHPRSPRPGKGMVFRDEVLPPA